MNKLERWQPICANCGEKFEEADPDNINISHRRAALCDKCFHDPQVAYRPAREWLTGSNNHIEGIPLDRKAPAHRDAPKLLWRLRGAFQRLHAQGYITRHGRWICCSNCGHARLREFDQYVFWCVQTHDYNVLQNANAYLQWHGNGVEIARACEDAGLVVEWNGARDKSIHVSLPRFN